jgi:CSLREA domain-containing protein
MSNHRSIHRLFFIVALFLAITSSPSFLTARAAPNATITVNSTADVVADDGQCTLREAITAANTDTASGNTGGECPAGSGADTITLPAGTYTLTRSGHSENNNATGDLDLLNDLTINGAGADITIIDANHLDRGMQLFNGVTATLNDITITNGFTPIASARHCWGGAIDNEGGTLTIRDSILSNNTTKRQPGGLDGCEGGGVDNYQGTLIIERTTITGNTTGDGVEPSRKAGFGGGVANWDGTMIIRDSVINDNTAGDTIDNMRDGKGGGVFSSGGTVTIENTTISGNTAHGFGGGTFVDRGTMDLIHVTITGNTADSDNDFGGFHGGGVHQENVTVNLKNSIVAGNQDLTSSTSHDCSGTVTSQGYNLVGVGTGCPSDGTGDQTTSNPKLEALADNGGPTQTHAMEYTSPAVDGIPNGVNGCGTDYTTDQRGETRPIGGLCDIGAYESPYIFWDGGGTDDKTSTAANWRGDLLPGETNIPVFYNIGEEITLDADLTVAGWILDSAGLGDGIMVWPDPRLTVNGDWLQLDGYFNGDYYGIIDVARDFNISGGQFIVPRIGGTGWLSVGGGINHTSGNFDADGGRLILDNTTDQTLNTTSALGELILNDGLLGYWKLDEDSGTTAIDSSGYGQHGTLNGSPAWAADAPSKINFYNPHSLQLNRGTADYVDISDTPTIDALQELSLSTWVNLDSVPGGSGYTYMRFIQLRGEKAVLRYVDLDGTGKLQFYIRVDGSTKGVSVNHAWQTGTWYHVAGTYDGSHIRLYLDGAEVGTPLAVSGTVDTGSGVRLSHSGSSEGLDGLLDDVRVYNRALSGTEISTLADGSRPQTSVATTTLAGTLDVRGDLTLNSGTLDVSGSNYGLNLARDMSYNGGIFEPRSSTVTLDGNLAQNVDSTGIAFNNLTVANTNASKKVDASKSALVVNGMLHIQDGILLSASDFNHVQIDTNGTLEMAGDMTVSGNWTQSGVFEGGSHALDIAGDFTISGGTFDAPQGAAGLMTVSGDFEQTAGAFNGQNGTQTIIGDYNLSGGDFTASTGTLVVSGNFQQTAGIFNGQNGTQNISGNFNLSGGDFTASTGTLAISGNFQHTGGVFDPNGGRVVLSPTGAQTLMGAATTFYDLYINDGLVGYWKLDGNGTATDSSGYGNYGLLTGNPSWETATPEKIDFYDPYSLAFSRFSADGVKVSNTAEIDDLDELTLSIWVRLGYLPDDTYMRFISLGNEKAVLRYKDVGGNMKLQFYMNIGGSLRNFEVDHAWDANTWYHVAGTYDGNTMRLYLDGVEQPGAVSITGTVGKGDGIYLSWPPNSAESLDGWLDDVRIYNRALTGVEISILAAGDHPKTSLAAITPVGDVDVDGDLTLNSGTLRVPEPEGYWKLDEGSGTVASDSTANDYTGTLANSPTWSGEKPALQFTNSGSLSFDRSSPADYVNVPDIPNIDDLQELSLATWVNLETTPGGSGYTYMRFVQLGSEKAVLRYVDNNGMGKLQFFMRIDGSTRGIAVNHAWQTGTWYHVIGTYDGSHIRLYLDGGEVGTPLAVSGTVDTGDGVRLSHSGSSEALDGLLDDVRVYDQALSAAEVQALANGYDIRPQTITIARNLTYNGGIFEEPRGGVVTLDGSGTQKVDIAGINLHNLTVNNTSEIQKVDASGSALVVSDTLHILDGTLLSASDYHHVQINGAGTLELSGDVTVSGNWAGNGTFTPNNHAVTFDGLVTQTVAGAAAFYDLTVASSATISDTSSGGLAVNGTLTNHGTLQRMQAVNGSSEVNFFNTGSYGGLILNANNTDLGDTTVTISGAQDCTNNPGETVQRCFDIDPENATGRNVFATFYFAESERSGNSCHDLNAYHWNGSGWDALTLDASYGTNGRSCGTEPYSLRVQNVGDFSPFVLKSSVPTVVQLIELRVQSASRNIMPIYAVALSIIIALFWQLRKWQQLNR